MLGDGGLRVEPEPDALAAAMIAVLDDPTRRAAFRRLVRVAMFSWARTARRTLSTSEETVARVPEAGVVDGPMTSTCRVAGINADGRHRIVRFPSRRGR